MKRKKNRRNSKIPLSWRIWQSLVCSVAGVLLFAAIYLKFFVELAVSVGSAPDPVERVVFSTGFAVFFTILMAVFSNEILQRIYKKQSMADIAEDISKEVAGEVLSEVVGSIVGGSTGGSGTKGGGGSFGGGGASGNY